MRITKKYSIKDIAASTQLILEKTITKCIKDLSKDKINLALAGGVFANVKLNQKIKELKNVKDIYIFPAKLHHLVYPFKSKVERISVSVNFADKINAMRNLQAEGER